MANPKSDPANDVKNPTLTGSIVVKNGGVPLNDVKRNNLAYVIIKDLEPTPPSKKITFSEWKLYGNPISYVGDSSYTFENKGTLDCGTVYAGTIKGDFPINEKNGFTCTLSFWANFGELKQILIDSPIEFVDEIHLPYQCP